VGNPYGIIDPNTGQEFTQTRQFYDPEGNVINLDPVQLTQHMHYPDLEPMVRSDPDPQFILDWKAGKASARSRNPITPFALPNGGQIDMWSIANQLGGAYDLGWYRGRRYYNYATGAMQTISQNPAMSEFWNLGTVPPVSNAHMANWGCNVDIQINIGYAPWDGGWVLEYQATGNDYTTNVDIAAYFDVSRYTNISNAIGWAGGDGGVGFSCYRYATPQGGLAGFSAQHTQSGAQWAWSMLYFSGS
jgi:hypothetical protein